MSDCRICGSDKPLVCDPCHIVALENARTAALEEVVKAVETCLKSYTLQYTRDSNDNGISIVDALTPPEETVITTGLKEIELLTDYLNSTIEDFVAKGAVD